MERAGRFFVGMAVFGITALAFLPLWEGAVVRWLLADDVYADTYHFVIHTTPILASLAICAALGLGLIAAGRRG